MPRQSKKMIVVEEGRHLASKLKRLYKGGSSSVVSDTDCRSALRRMESESFDVLLVTSKALHSPASCADLMERVTAKSPRTQVVFLVNAEDMDTAREALRSGASRYARLPVSDEELRLLVDSAVDNQFRFGVTSQQGEAGAPDRFNEILGRSRPMQEVFRQIRQAAAADVPVLLYGETGSGKDVAAKAIHSESPRRDKPFIPVNLGAVPSELVGSELFGYEQGAFTGAERTQQGKFELGNGGTVFLDEIGSIEERMQVSLLRLIEHKRFHRLGGRRWIDSDARIIAATNHDLQAAAKDGAFREDLLYRLDVFRITLPPLRERREDIPLLIDEFVNRFNESFGKGIRSVSPECAQVLESYSWPGNVRELKNVVQRAVIVCNDEVIEPSHLPPRFLPDKPEHRVGSFRPGDTLDEVEKQTILLTLEHTGNNRTAAAEMLGISRRALYSRLKKHGIQ